MTSAQDTSGNSSQAVSVRQDSGQSRDKADTLH